jgi:hypothetical protein
MDERHALVAAARKLARELGRDRITRSEFTRHTGRSGERAQTLFGGWRAFCRAAGLTAGKPGTQKIGKDEIFAAMRDAFLAQGGVGTQREFLVHFRHGRNLLSRQGWSWREALGEFGVWAAANAPDFPYFDQLPGAADAGRPDWLPHVYEPWQWPSLSRFSSLSRFLGKQTPGYGDLGSWRSRCLRRSLLYFAFCLCPAIDAAPAVYARTSWRWKAT